MGLVYAVVYYGLFRVAIHAFDLKTLGREDEEEVVALAPAGARGPAFVKALGGPANIRSVDACTTRLRLVLADNHAADEATLKALGARGLFRPSDKALQVVLGPAADQVAGEIRAALAGRAPAVSAALDAEAVFAALGGVERVLGVEACSSRLKVYLKPDTAVDEARLRALGVRSTGRSKAGMLHIIVGDSASKLAERLHALIEPDAAVVAGRQ